MSNEKSVVEVIDHILDMMHTCPANADCHNRLMTIRDGIFLELPEDRIALLCRVGRAINDGVPSGKMIGHCDTTKGRIDDYWYRIRDFMDAVFAGSPGQSRFVIKGGDGGTLPGEKGGDVHVTLVAPLNAMEALKRTVNGDPIRFYRD